MASSTVKVSLLADTTKFQKAMGDAGKVTQNAAGKFGTAGKLIAGAGIAMVGSAVVGFLQDATAAALEDAKAQELLKLALENSTGATGDQVAAVEKWIDKTALATGVADDELRPAMAELARATGDVSEAQDIMGVAMDIAAAKGIPLETIVKAIAKAHNGNIGALGRLGIATKDADGATMTFEDTLAEASRTMGGATATAADTAAGKMQILRVRMDEAKESIGNALIPILSDLAQQGSDTLKVMGFLGEKIGDLLPGSDDMGASIMDWVGPLAISGELMAIAADMVDDMTAKIEAQADPLKDGAHRYDVLGQSIDDVTVALQRSADEIRNQMDPMFNLISKTNDLATAQNDSAIARDAYGEGSPEHLEALRNEAGAFMDLKDAQVKAADESGITRETFAQNLRDMKIFTGTEIALMIAEFDKLDGRTIDTTIRIRQVGGTSGRGSIGHGSNVVGHKGGVVPGVRGQEVAATLLAGETVVPLDGNLKGAGAGTVINLHVTALDPAAAARAVVQALQQYNRTNGAIPITVRA